ncbi:unnamed protein product [Gordionus sp. m RMFG-2023]
MNHMFLFLVYTLYIMSDFVVHNTPVNPWLMPNNWQQQQQQQHQGFAQPQAQQNWGQQQQQNWGQQQQNWQPPQPIKKPPPPPPKKIGGGGIGGIGGIGGFSGGSFGGGGGGYGGGKKNPFHVVPSFKFGRFVKDTTSSTTTSSTTDTTALRIKIIKVIKKKPDCCDNQDNGINSIGGGIDVGSLDWQKSKDDKYNPKMAAHLNNKAYAASNSIQKKIQNMVEIDAESAKKPQNDFSLLDETKDSEGSSRGGVESLGYRK